MKRLVPTAALLAVAAAFPAAAQSNEELLKELRALRERVNQLEQKLQQPAAPGAAPGAAAAGQWGMTPEQARELSRVAVKTEAMQDSFESQGFKGLKISGQMDPTYIYNKRQDSSSFVFLNNGDARYTYDNSYFGMVVLDIAKETESGTLWKLTLAPERGTGALINSGSIVHEASVSIPLTDLQTRLWLGQIPDWTGYEITLPAGNKLITHNLLFDFMAPTAYTGAVMDVKSGKWWMRGGLANVNSVRNSSGNKAPALIYRVDYSKGEFDGFGFSGVHGKIANFAADQTVISVDPATGLPLETPVFPDQIGKNTMANLFEVDAYFTRGDWSLFGQASYGQQKQAAIYNSDGLLRDAKWWGVSGLVAYKITPRFETTLRVDYVSNTDNGGGLLGYSYDDSINGIGRGLALDASGAAVVAGDETKGSNRYALSLGTSYRVDENATFKLEYRYDAASQAVFGIQSGGVTTGFSKTNHLFGASMVVSF